MCYVGKATKIFFFIVAVLMVIGLILGFSVLKHGSEKIHKCSGYSCEPPPQFVASPDPEPDPVPVPIQPTPAPPTAPSTTTTTTPAPVYNSPPSPVALAQGPVHA